MIARNLAMRQAYAQSGGTNTVLVSRPDLSDAARNRAAALRNIQRRTLNNFLVSIQKQV